MADRPGVPNIVGNFFNNYITGNNFANDIYGLDGSDTIYIKVTQCHLKYIKKKYTFSKFKASIIINCEDNYWSLRA